MTIRDSEIEEACNFLLQKNITFELKNKKYKQGQMILYYQKNFYITFVLNTSKKIKEKIEIPIPYGIEIHEDENLIYMDYRIKTLAKYCPDIETNLLLYPSKIKKNKFWDTILLINAN
jgi:hypothetical protein